MNQLIQLDRYRQAAPQLYDALREQIVTLQLKPGDVLSRIEIAKQFGVSQTPVRDALMKLEQEDLVHVFPQAATRVSQIDLRAARQAHFLRFSVELELVHRFASQPNERVNHELKAVMAELKRCAKSKDSIGFMQADRQFHHLLYEHADMMEIWALIQGRSGHIDRLRHLHLPADGKMQQIIKDHQDISDAIQSGRPDAAQKAVRKHLSGTLAQAEWIKQMHPDYF